MLKPVKETPIIIIQEINNYFYLKSYVGTPLVLFFKVNI